MEAQNAIILNDLSRYLGSDPGERPEEETAHQEFSLPRADSGKDAWLFLAAGFVIEALVWGVYFHEYKNLNRMFSELSLKSKPGFPFSFGVFQEYYGHHELFSSNASGIAVIGTTATVNKHLPLYLYKHSLTCTGTNVHVGPRSFPCLQKVPPSSQYHEVGRSPPHGSRPLRCLLRSERATPHPNPRSHLRPRRMYHLLSYSAIYRRMVRAA